MIFQQNKKRSPSFEMVAFCQKVEMLEMILIVFLFHSLPFFANELPISSVLICSCPPPPLSLL